MSYTTPPKKKSQDSPNSAPRSAAPNETARYVEMYAPNGDIIRVLESDRADVEEAIQAMQGRVVSPNATSAPERGLGPENPFENSNAPRGVGMTVHIPPGLRYLQVFMDAPKPPESPRRERPVATQVAPGAHAALAARTEARRKRTREAAEEEEKKKKKEEEEGSMVATARKILPAKSRRGKKESEKSTIGEDEEMDDGEPGPSKPRKSPRKSPASKK